MSTKVQIKMVPGFERILDREPGVKRLMRRRAEEAASIAKSLAPVATGDYRDSIGVDEDIDGVKLVATDFKAHWIEWGTVRTRAFAPLRTAARKVADRFVEH